MNLANRRSSRKSIPAVFLDRDGTLNVEVNRLCSAEQLQLVPGVGEAIRRLNRAGFLALVVTNQSVIAWGECSEAELELIHDKLKTLLAEQGAYLDAIYHCPHYPGLNLSGERLGFEVACDCRKPGTGMIERARSDFSIRMEESWMIGDTTVDLQTAHNAGIRSILVHTGHAGRDGRWLARADFEFADLAEAVEFVTKHHASQ